MTTLSQAHAILATHFLDTWKVAGEPRTPFCLDNETLSNPPPTWVRFSVRDLAGGQETIGAVGNRKFRRQALARLEIYVPPGEGTSAGNVLADHGMDMLEARSLTGIIHLYDASVIQAGLVDQGRWFLLTAQAYLDYEHVK